ncbi:MAG: nuclear transport factor 2 family protein [Candidatus Krumholzibacteriota bacterium]|nr:nuclear transport factor 2 family protein [Candidatus Krumholzibacteriota bacterium]
MDRLSRGDIEAILDRWLDAWDRYDLSGVIEPFAEKIVFEHWDGKRIKGKKQLLLAWRKWFDDNGGFKFVKEEIFIDETAQKALFRWTYRGPAFSDRYRGGEEVRKGIDILVFKSGRIVEKSSYSKTMIEIDGKTLKSER